MDLEGKLRFFGYPATRAVLAVARHDPGARLRRGLLALAACWGLAAVTILVPIAHFVLVPGFFLLGIWLLVKRLGEEATIVSVTGDCPKCGEPRSFVASGRLAPELRVQCPVCRNELELGGRELAGALGQGGQRPSAGADRLGAV